MLAPQITGLVSSKERQSVRFFGPVPVALPSKADDLFRLLVREVEDVDFAAGRNDIPHLAGQRLDAFLTGRDLLDETKPFPVPIKPGGEICLFLPRGCGAGLSPARRALVRQPLRLHTERRIFNKPIQRRPAIRTTRRSGKEAIDARRDWKMIGRKSSFEKLASSARRKPSGVLAIAWLYSCDEHL